MAYIPRNNIGLKGDYRSLAGLSISAGSGTVTSATSQFRSSDVGRTLVVYGAGTSSDGFLGDELFAVITSYTSPTQVAVNTLATASVSGANGGVGTDNSTRMQAMLVSNTVLELPPTGGNYFFAQAMSFDGVSNVAIIGNGSTFSWASTRVNSYPSPGEPERHLFGLLNCSDWTFIGVTGVNIGQPQAIIEVESEYGYATTLNGVPVEYNRWWNKNCNTGMFVQQQSTQNTTLRNIKTVRTGGLLQTNSSGSVGGQIVDCIVDGFGLVAISPADGMEIRNVWFDNSASPAILSAESIYSTSHMIYASAGNGDIFISGCTIIGCRGTAIQWNTGSNAVSAGNRVVGNRFVDCARAGSIQGTYTDLEITFSSNTYYQTGMWSISTNVGRLIFSGESWSGDYAENDEFSGAFGINNGKNIIITGCIFSGVGGAGDQAVITANCHVTNACDMLIEGCNFDSLCNRALRVTTDHNAYTGKMTLRGCNFSSQVAFGLGAGATVTADGRKKFFVENCSFIGTGSSQLLAKFGVTLVNNTHYLSSTNSGVEIDLKTNAGNVDIIGCTFSDHNTGTSITLTSAAANNNTINLIGCKFIGIASLATNGNTWRRKAGNYFEATNIFDLLPLL